MIIGASSGGEDVPLQHENVYTRHAVPETSMDVAKILAELRQEREQIEEAILSLERLARGRGRRRGRPPSWMAEITAKRRGRPPGTKNKNTPKSVSNSSMA